MIECSRSFLAILISLFPLILWAQPDYYSSENILRFAKHLYDRRVYQRAAGEYQRYLSLTGAANDSVRFAVAQSLRLGGEPRRAVPHYEQVVAESPDSLLRAAALLRIGVSLHALGRSDQAVRFLMDNASTLTARQVEANHLRVALLLEQRKWKEAFRFSAGQINCAAGQDDELTLHLNRLAAEGLSLPRKSPALAGVLSAVVPGSGRAYSGRWGDALYSVLLIGVTGLQSYIGFRDHGVGSGGGWIFGVLCAGFYGGNIYGSVTAAAIVNEKREDTLLRHARQLVPLHIE